MLLLAILLTADISQETVVVDRVDRLEINHVHCPHTGRETLCQVIYWRWHVEDSRYHVAAWRMASSWTARFRRDGREWVETREDGPVRREIRSPQFRETWTFFDPEVEDRRTYPPELRRGLRKISESR